MTLRAAHAGYSLMELLIVLAVIGMMAGLAAPPFLRMIDQQRRIADQAEVSRALTGLPMAAREAGRDLVVRPAGASETAVPQSAIASPLLAPEVHAIGGLPPGWKATPLGDLWIRSDGVCLGGIVEITEPNGARRKMALDPPHCTPRALPKE